MGLLAILMAALLVAGLAAGAMLAALGAVAPVATGLLTGTVFCAALAAAYLAVEPLARLARRLSVRGHAGAARLCAAAFGLLPMLVLSAGQLAVASPAESDGSSSWLLIPWNYAVATGPATLLGLAAGRARKTLWSIRAYAGHLSCWILLAATAGGGLVSPAIAALTMLPAILPATVGFLVALADPRALREVRL